MQIVPKDDTLVIEARVNPVDIDVVHPGLLAKVRLTALSRRRFPPLRARVLWVSADQITDTLEGSHYLVRLEILENPAKKTVRRETISRDVFGSDDFDGTDHIDGSLDESN
jgi:HlyD family secretion protein